MCNGFGVGDVSREYPGARAGTRIVQPGTGGGPPASPGGIFADVDHSGEGVTRIQQALMSRGERRRGAMDDFGGK